MDSPPRKQFKVLLAGDVCVDRMYVLNIYRQHPENPEIPLFNIVNDPHTQGVKLGMADNVRECMEALKLEVRTIFPKPSDMGTKTRYFEQNYNIVDYSSKPAQIFRIDEDKVANTLRNISSEDLIGIDAIVVSDYCKGAVDRQWLEHTQHLAKIYNIPMFVDTKKVSIDYLDYAIVKINSQEAAALLRGPTSGKLIVTRGSSGALYKGKTYHLEAPVTTLDVCGAGDAFLSALVYGYLRYNDMEHAIKLANRAGAACVQQLGTYAPKLNEIDYEINRYRT